MSREASGNLAQKKKTMQEPQIIFKILHEQYQAKEVGGGGGRGGEEEGGGGGGKGGRSGGRRRRKLDYKENIAWNQKGKNDKNKFKRDLNTEESKTNK